ncbi:hypothetical protein Ctob_009086 [Chrysochromulina tobinii]|uniref:Apple domain-containing protein n=1 Tax=Chrysochromulina tobinii TaxID=1460289 RepID=A0A0M0JS83_9EUKA|nr:hypothetical protein Ctob_009086 [Chrysochromulina tobinii]|eukprot:KOO29073.1 hypothetical protein Ctob_009086 [Chrysochromulina sp. CCMP291]
MVANHKELRYLALTRVARAERNRKDDWRRFFLLFVVGAIGIMWYYQPAESSIFSEEPQEAVPVAALSAATTVTASMPMCGDGKCERPETMASCLADCPGVTTEAMCGEEPHSDPGGYAVVWGATHTKASASECCAACAAHAATPKNAKRPCNSWVFCHSYPQCWSLDTGNWHGFGECWLKWQPDTKHPLYGQRGKFSDEFRKKHWSAHMTGLNPDGTRRNLTVPTHVPWTGGVMGTTYDPTVRWTTGLEGLSSNKGEQTVLWRAWETREENLARGVKPESMGSAWGSK